MKHTTRLLLAALLVLALVFGAGQAPQLMVPWLSQKISQALPGTKVSIGSISGTFFNSVILSNVSVEDKYSKISFEKTSLHYTLPGLFQKRIDNLELQNGEAIYHSLNEPMPKISYGAGSDEKPPAVTLKKLSVQNLKMDIETQDLALNGKISFSRDMELERFLDGHISIPNLRLGAITVKELSTSLDYAQRGVLTVQQIAFQKWSLNSVQANYEIKKEKLLMTLESLDWLGTTVKGAGEINFTKPPAYSCQLQISTLPMTQILTAYEWDKKVSVSGEIGGFLELSGEGSKLTAVKGELRNTTDGNIVILDQAFLQRIADSAKQPIEIIKATFENYHYNEGEIAVSMDNQNIRLGINLNGEAGKRNLEVYLHDLF